MDIKQISLLVTGSIAAEKRTLPLIEALRKNGHAVTVLLTRAPLEWKWVDCEKAAAASGHKVLTDVSNLTSGPDIAAKKKALYLPHAILVAPASADFISQLAHKSSDVARAILTAQGDSSLLIIAPAMNNWMWGHPAVARNCDTLKKNGVVFLGPVKGLMACGDEGYGRMIGVDDLAAGVQAALEGKHLHSTYSYYETAHEEGKKAAPFRPPEGNAPILVALGGGNFKWPDVINLVGEINRTGLAADYLLDPQWKGYAEELKNLTGRTVVWDYFQVPGFDGMEHIKLPERSRCVFIPFLDDATAAAMAQGRADTLFLAAYLASKAPVLTTKECLRGLSPAAASALRQDGLGEAEDVKDLARLCSQPEGLSPR